MAHHVIDTSTTGGNLLQSAINHIRAAQAELGRVRAMQVAAGGDAAIEGGIFGVATNEGAAVYAIVGSLNTSIQGIAAGFIDPIDQGA